MNKEIKEILDKFKNYNLSTRETKLLLNYITNLQKENEQLKKCNKESITFLNQDDIRDILIQKDYKIFNLQQRIDKAIEYINKELKNMPINGCYERLAKILFMLGSDEDV